ncbi:HDOD domain-containing protein [Halothiobacillus sp. DCM-1]|uniref:HDOD domain-containing protein n=1 Tax=Halothiobacillus sp. DCM-1 TaxID=3112558 RepID=UPI003245A768
MSLPADWIEHLKAHPLPVRNEVHQRLVELIRRDELDFGELSGWLRRDPAAAGFVMGAAARAQRAKQRDAPHTLDHALSLLGAGWIRQYLPSLPTLEETLVDPAQRAGYLTAVARSLHAARHAESWLVELRDTSYEVVVVATLLHNFLELALWRDAPDLIRSALIAVQDRSQPTLGHAISAALHAQGIDLKSFEQAVNAHYYLPAQLFADEAATPILARQHQTIVLLARRLAFFAETGWYHAEILATQQEISALLKRDCPATDSLIHQVAVQTAREFADMGFYSPAGLLIDTAPGSYWPYPAGYGIPPRPLEAARLALSARCAKVRGQAGNLLKALLTTLIEELNCTELLLFSRAVAPNQLALSLNRRRAEEPLAASLDLTQNPLLERLLHGNKALAVQADNRSTLNRLLDADGQRVIARDCLILTLHRQTQPFALLVVDIDQPATIDTLRSVFMAFQTYWPD